MILCFKIPDSEIILYWLYFLQFSNKPTQMEPIFLYSRKKEF